MERYEKQLLIVLTVVAVFMLLAYSIYVGLIDKSISEEYRGKIKPILDMLSSIFAGVITGYIVGYVVSRYSAKSTAEATMEVTYMVEAIKKHKHDIDRVIDKLLSGEEIKFTKIGSTSFESTICNNIRKLSYDEKTLLEDIDNHFPNTIKELKSFCEDVKSSNKDIEYLKRKEEELQRKLVDIKLTPILPNPKCKYLKQH